MRTLFKKNIAIDGYLVVDLLSVITAGSLVL